MSVDLKILQYYINVIFDYTKDVNIPQEFLNTLVDKENYKILYSC